MFFNEIILIIGLLITHLEITNSYYVYETEEEPIYLNDFQFRIDNKDAHTDFPNSLTVKFSRPDEVFDIQFKKLSNQVYPDIYTLDKNGNPMKNDLEIHENFEHYVDLNSQGYATLVLNKKSNDEPFRLIARVFSKVKANTTYDIYPVKVSERRKRSLGIEKEFHHAIKKRSTLKEERGHGYINPLDNKDYIIINETEYFQQKNTAKKIVRIGGSGPIVFECETLIVTDPSIFEEHKRISNSVDQNYVFGQMRIYFSHLMHAVNQKYQNSFANDNDMKMNVKLTNILIITKQAEAPWGDKSIVGDPSNPTYQGQDVLVGTPTITRFRSFMNSKMFPFEYDHAMGLIKKDLWLDGTGLPSARAGLLGLAYVKGICSSYRYSVSEEQGGFSSIFTIAHEMGHNFGSVHDGEPAAISCPSTDYFIMTPSLRFDKIENMQRFSTCSISQFKTALLLNGDWNADSYCLTNIPTNIPEEFQNANYSLTGQLYNFNDQCKMVHGSASSFCHFKASEICSKLWCRKSNNDQYCWSGTPAAEGTTCSSGKICINGNCTSSDLAPVSLCPFGNELVMNETEDITLPTKYVTCSEFLTILNDNGKSQDAFCSSLSGQSSCCFTCLKYRYSDCRDKYSNCNELIARCASGVIGGTEQVKDACCATCKTRPITCSSNPAICLNGGSCTNIALPTSLLGYTCSCLQGFSGYNCETKNNCQPNPCKNGGVCTETGRECPFCFTCICTNSFTGSDCSLLKTTTRSTTLETYPRIEFTTTAKAAFLSPIFSLINLSFFLIIICFN
ncbi:unnamed protein product [Brachionus calyciflorus]|uniref:Uncharacterized protein n=1 Tax=Brachionus calyciflorus TaxID=104777 RepID=A0A813WDA9_9BILA|nr:unnamed protein product [Brachionus calyciflorus]